MKTSEIRDKFIKFFQDRGHTYVPGASTIPVDDQTLLFNIAGMTQFKTCLLGQEIRSYKRATNVQKCIRVLDLDDVGKDGRHCTMFEMLGSWSFGDYYKKEAIQWAFELTRDVFAFDLNKVWTTVHHSDQESYDLWKSIGIPETRIRRLGDKDNFWAMGPTGPCGPCTELYYDQGPEVGSCYTSTGIPCETGPGCDCDRYLEFWNLVFMQYNRQEDGALQELPIKSVDTGAGLERISALINKKTSNFDIDVFENIKLKTLNLSKISGPFDNLSDLEKESVRVICDHIRMLCFTLGDGATFSNEGRGYVLRRVLRRAVRHIKRLAPLWPENRSFLKELVPIVIEDMGSFYCELKENQKIIETLLEDEELRFHVTLEQGLQKFEDYIKQTPSDTLSGEEAFHLHDRYGFPLDLTEVLCQERKMKVDKAAFEALMNQQKERSRADSKFYKFEKSNSVWHEIHQGTSSFVGYEFSKEAFFTTNENFAKFEIKHTLKVRQPKHDVLEIIFEETPFYPEGGGQVCDKGKIRIPLLNAEALELELTDVQRSEQHIVHSFQTNKTIDLALLISSLQQTSVEAYLDLKARQATAKHHTATHLLQAALRTILGPTVRQAGSLVCPDYLRFDFTHGRPLTQEEINLIEDLVNDRIQKNEQVLTFADMPLAEAKERGAIAMFSEKYQANVRVLEIGDFSKELCGGTHVPATGHIGLFKITAEGSVTSGVRRIEAKTGKSALHILSEQDNRLKNIASILRVPLAQIEQKSEQNQYIQKDLEKRIKDYEQKLAYFISNDLILNSSLKIDNELQFVSKQVSEKDISIGILEAILDCLKQKPNTISFISLIQEDRLAVYLTINSALAKKEKLTAGKILQATLAPHNGKGGGRDDFAKGSINGAISQEELERTLQHILNDR